LYSSPASSLFPRSPCTHLFATNIISGFVRVALPALTIHIKSNSALSI
jgi:hypothetical protein